jgi:hypothetical protein
MSLGVRVDRSADLGHPQLDAIVNEQRECETELVAAECPMRFADDDAVEAPTRIGECVQQPGGFGAALPGERSRLADVEELCDDLAVDGGDQRVGSVELPGSARGGVLAVFGADSTVEPERPHGHEAITSRTGDGASRSNSSSVLACVCTMTFKNARASPSVRAGRSEVSIVKAL